MTILQAIILGIVEGITEYLPVSSTGHLIVTQYFLGLVKSDAMDAFSVCIQGGAILAVLGLYYQRVKQMIMGLFGKDEVGRRLLINILVAFCPAVIIGLTFSDLIKSYLFNAQTVAVTWLLGGVFILIFTAYRRRKGKEFEGQSLESMTWKGALTVGFMQCLAMCPGVSRSLTTMMGGIVTGLSVAAAVEFSFLLGLLCLTAATCYDAVKYGDQMVSEIGFPAIIAGTITAWISALIAVRWLVNYLQKHSLNIFGWYRIAVGIFMFGLMLMGADLLGEKPDGEQTEAKPQLELSITSKEA